tara:strand:+ start:492 stop:980 length:489 start_codon:yes stop_codon:yes gene_type:complete
MSDEQDDPLLGLLTDIAEGVAKLTERVDAMEANAAAHQEKVNEALATIAEIATRTYYASKPTSALPNDVINANIMNPMIERWPLEWTTTFPSSEFKLLKELGSLSVSEIEAQLRQRATIAEDATNAQRIRHARALVMLKEEMDRRFKAHEQSEERDAPGRSR